MTEFSKYYGERVLDRVRFTLGHEESCVLMEPKGSVKRTLLPILVGIKEPRLAETGFHDSDALLLTLTGEWNIMNRLFVYMIMAMVVISPPSLFLLTHSQSMLSEQQTVRAAVYIPPEPYPKPSPPSYSDTDPETPWGIERIFRGYYDGYIPSTDVDVAILDTGISLQHSDLYPNIKWGYDAVNGQTYDDGGHGTHCAGTVGAIRNGFGVVGVYSHVHLYAIKVLNSNGIGNVADLIEGINAACKGPDGRTGTADDADVISMSLTCPHSEDLHNAIINAYNMGIVIVAAAGNSGDGNPSTTEIAYPAAYPEVIAVSATDSYDYIASFSNSGDYIEVAAPGVSIYSTYYNNGYTTLSGTSMACPHVSGLVALIIAVKGKMPVGTFWDTSTNTIRGYLHITAYDRGPLGWDPSFGYGIAMASQVIA